VRSGQELLDGVRDRAVQALVDEAKRLNCPIPDAVKQFLA